jgi:hypothetical protein
MTTKQREVRCATAELRLLGDAENDANKKKRVGGYAARFNLLSEDLGGFFEKIAPGAFKTSLLTADVRCLFNHDANIIMGRTASGTLRVVEDDNGLAYEADAPDTQLIRDMVIAPIERGDVNQCSFAFYTVRDHWENVDGKMIRTLLECELLDVSPVTYPAYKDTNVSARALEHVNAATAPIMTDILRRRLELAV